VRRLQGVSRAGRLRFAIWIGFSLMHFLRLTAAAWAVAQAFSAQACDACGEDGADTTAAQTIVVTGSKDRDKSTLTQPDLASAKKAIETTAGGANVIDAASYRSGRVSTLADALGFSPGVVVQPRFGAEETRLSIRGSGAQRTFHGRGLKLMQDGVPLNLADGSFDFQAIEPLAARYIEVWRGANALQYGAGTLGGAINFVSPNGYNSDVFTARGEAGSFGYRRGLVSTGDVNGAFDHYLSLSAFAQDGFRAHARQDTQRAFANLGYSLDANLETRFYLGAVKSRSELPGSLTWAQLQADPRQANPGSVSGDQRRDIDWLRLSNKTVLQQGSERFEFFVFANAKKLFHPIFQVLDQDNRDIGAELRFASDAPVDGRRNRVVLGLAPAQGRTEEDRWVNTGGQRGARTNQSEQRSKSLAFYVENQHHLNEQWVFVAGLQHQKASRRLNDLFIANTGSDTVSESFHLRYEGSSPRIGLRWQAAPTVQWFANLSGSFEPPSFGELSGGVSPVLNRAQRGNTAEIGTRGELHGTRWDVALYHARLKDELLQVGTNVANAPITINAERSRKSGLEAGASGTAWHTEAGALQWRGTLTWQHFRLDGDPTFGNRRLPGLSGVLARAELGWRFGAQSLAPDLVASVNAQHVGRHAVDFAHTVFSPAHSLVGVKLAQDIGPRWSWFVEGRNLADKRHASTTGIVRNANGQDVAQFLPGDGRSVYAGLTFKL
jgi:iron complex outermembrane recepter protein